MQSLKKEKRVPPGVPTKSLVSTGPMLFMTGQGSNFRCDTEFLMLSLDKASPIIGEPHLTESPFDSVLETHGLHQPFCKNAAWPGKIWKVPPSLFSVDLCIALSHRTCRLSLLHAAGYPAGIPGSNSNIPSPCSSWLLTQDLSGTCFTSWTNCHFCVACSALRVHMLRSWQKDANVFALVLLTVPCCRLKKIPTLLGAQHCTKGHKSLK